MSGSERYDIVFVALARNCSRHIPSLVARLEEFQADGLRVHLLVGENGSKDDTRTRLEQAGPLISVTPTDRMSAIPNRLLRMAAGREALREMVESWPAESIGVVDLDEPFLQSVTPAMLRASLEQLGEGEFFARAATSRPVYYDLLAFEDAHRSFVGLDQKIRALRRSPVKYYRFFTRYIYRQQEALTRAEDVQCVSAFNGLSLYRAAAYSAASYLSVVDPPICEHVVFNRGVRAATGLDMVIDSALVVPTPKEHARKSLPGFVAQRVLKLGRRGPGVLM